MKAGRRRLTDVSALPIHCRRAAVLLVASPPVCAGALPTYFVSQLIEKKELPEMNFAEIFSSIIQN